MPIKKHILISPTVLNEEPWGKTPTFHGLKSPKFNFAKMFQHFPATTSDNHINDQYPFLKVSSEHLDTQEM